MQARPDGDFATLQVDNYPRVFTYILRRINDVETSEELTADVFRIAWQKGCTESGTGVGWLLRVARNVVGNEYRGRRRARELEQKLQEGIRAQLQTNPDPKKELIGEALRGVSPKHREVLLLAYWDELTTAELAQALNCSASTAGVRLHRARRAFAQVLPAALQPEREV